MKTKRTPSQTVYARLKGDEQARFQYRRKVHNLRRLVAGDLSALDGVQGSSQTAQNLDDHTSKAPGSERQRQFYKIFTRDAEVGRSNLLQQMIKTLLFQTSYQMPSIDFEGLDEEVAGFMGVYLKTRLGAAPRGCDAVHQMRMALLSYMIEGIGWAGVTFDESGAPVIRYFDTLDMSWDRGANVISDIRWLSVLDRRPCWQWELMFGGASFKEFDDKDTLVELEFYYDVQGERGTHEVYCHSGKDADKPILSEANPYYYTVDGFEQAFLPIDPIYYLQQPSVAYPTGVAEMMLPHQVAVLEGERYVRKAVRAGAPVQVMNSTGLNAQEVDRFMDGDIDVLRANGKVPASEIIHNVPGLEIPATVAGWLQSNEQKLTEAGGVNPYASGGKVDGVRFASEVQAIQNQAGLVAGTVSKDHNQHWARIIEKYLATAALYDDAKLTLLYDGLRIPFGADNPVRDFIIPDANIVIREDTMQYRSREQAIQESVAKLEVAIKLAQMFPAGVKDAYESYLRATGEQNPGKMLEAPPMAPADAGAGADAETSVA